MTLSVVPSFSVASRLARSHLRVLFALLALALAWPDWRTSGLSIARPVFSQPGLNPTPTASVLLLPFFDLPALLGWSQP